MSDLGLWTGLNQGVQNTIAMGMNLMQLQSQREHQRALEVAQTEHLKLAQEQAEREKITFQHAERKRVEQERIENSIVPASLIAPQIHDNPKFKNTAVDAARNAGFKVDILPDGEIYTTNKAYSYIGNLMKTNTEFQKIATDSLIEDLVGKSTTLAAKITEIQQSGKEDKTLPALQQQQLAVKKQIGEMLGASRSIMEKILVEQAKPVQQDTVPYMTPDGKTVLINERDPNSQIIIEQRGLIPASAYKVKDVKEVNVANEIDTILGGMFPKYYTDPAERRRALEYYATPEGSVKVQKLAAEYAKSKIPPQFLPVQTAEGIVPFGTKGPAGGTFPKVTEAPKRPPQESDIAHERNFNQAGAIISELENKFKSAEKSLPKTASDRITGYPGRAIGIYAQTDAELASVKALIQASESKMIRALGEVGTLTDRDVARAEAAMPTVNDTKAVREKKFDQLRGLLSEIYVRGKRYETTKQNVSPGSPSQSLKDMSTEQLKKELGIND